MKTCLRWWLGGLLVLLAGLLQAPAQAQVPDRVGRIAYLSGDVQFYTDTTRAWEPAQLNAPVSSHNSLFAGAGSRAEIRFGATALALDSQTQLNIHQLDDDGFKASVGQGSLSLRVPRLEAGEVYELAAPGARYQLLQGGRFRIDAVEGGSSVTVFAGAVHALLNSGTVLVEAGKTLTTSGGGYLIMPARSSALDAWAQERERAGRNGQATRYVSPYMTGYEDLDANGRWAQDLDYGAVWYPTTYVSAGWAPYRDGRWVYRPPWGWTWVDAAPWGFAPFHYGRWVRIGASWAWAPGGYVARPSYAPALVVFIGGGSSGIAGIGSIGGLPSVGWYPLPPWERYRPAYAHSPSALRNLNNFTLASPPPRAWSQVGTARVLENQRYGVTMVPHGDFVTSRPVARSTLTVPLGALPTLAPLPVPPAPQVFPPPAGGTGAVPRERGPVSGAIPRDGMGGGRHDRAPAQTEAPRLVSPAQPAPPTFGREGGSRSERPLPVAPEMLPGREATGAPRGFGAPLPRPPVPAPEFRGGPREPMPTPRLDSPTPRLPITPAAPPAVSPAERPLPAVPLPERRFSGGEAMPVPSPRLAEPPHQRYEPQGRPEPGRDTGRESNVQSQPRPRFGSGDSGGGSGDSGGQRDFRGGDGGRRFGGPDR